MAALTAVAFLVGSAVPPVCWASPGPEALRQQSVKQSAGLEELEREIGKARTPPGSRWARVIGTLMLAGGGTLSFFSGAAQFPARAQQTPGADPASGMVLIREVRGTSAGYRALPPTPPSLAIPAGVVEMRGTKAEWVPLPPSPHPQDDAEVVAVRGVSKERVPLAASPDPNGAFDAEELNRRLNRLASLSVPTEDMPAFVRNLPILVYSGTATVKTVRFPTVMKKAQARADPRVTLDVVSGKEPVVVLLPRGEGYRVPPGATVSVVMDAGGVRDVFGPRVAALSQKERDDYLGRSEVWMWKVHRLQWGLDLVRRRAEQIGGAGDDRSHGQETLGRRLSRDAAAQGFPLVLPQGPPGNPAPPSLPEAERDFFLTRAQAGIRDLFQWEMGRRWGLLYYGEATSLERVMLRNALLDFSKAEGRLAATLPKNQRMADHAALDQTIRNLLGTMENLLKHDLRGGPEDPSIEGRLRYRLREIQLERIGLLKRRNDHAGALGLSLPLPEEIIDLAASRPGGVNVHSLVSRRHPGLKEPLPPDRIQMHVAALREIEVDLMRLEMREKATIARHLAWKADQQGAAVQGIESPWLAQLAADLRGQARVFRQKGQALALELATMDAKSQAEFEERRDRYEEATRGAAALDEKRLAKHRNAAVLQMNRVLAERVSRQQQLSNLAERYRRVEELAGQVRGLNEQIHQLKLKENDLLWGRTIESRLIDEDLKKNLAAQAAMGEQIKALRRAYIESADPPPYRRPLPRTAEEARLLDHLEALRRLRDEPHYNVIDRQRRSYRAHLEMATVRVRLDAVRELQYQQWILGGMRKELQFLEGTVVRLDEEIDWLERIIRALINEQAQRRLELILFEEERRHGLPLALPAGPAEASHSLEGFQRLLGAAPPASAAGRVRLMDGQWSEAVLWRGHRPVVLWNPRWAGPASFENLRMARDPDTGRWVLQEVIVPIIADSGSSIGLHAVALGRPVFSYRMEDGIYSVLAVGGGFHLDPGRPIPLGEVVRTDPKTGQRLPSEHGLVGHVATRVEWVKGPKGPGRYEVVPHFLARHVPIGSYRDALERKGPFDLPWGPDAVDAGGKPNKDSRYFGTMYLGGLDVHAREPQWVLDRYGVRADPGQPLPVVWVPTLRAEVIYEPRIQVNEEGNLVLTLRKQPAAARPAPPRGGLEELEEMEARLTALARAALPGEERGPGWLLKRSGGETVILVTGRPEEELALQNYDRDWEMARRMAEDLVRRHDRGMRQALFEQPERATRFLQSHFPDLEQENPERFRDALEQFRQIQDSSGHEISDGEQEPAAMARFQRELLGVVQRTYLDRAIPLDLDLAQEAEKAWGLSVRRAAEWVKRVQRRLSRGEVLTWDLAVDETVRFRREFGGGSGKPFVEITRFLGSAEGWAAVQRLWTAEAGNRQVESWPATQLLSQLFFQAFYPEIAREARDRAAEVSAGRREVPYGWLNGLVEKVRERLNAGETVRLRDLVNLNLEREDFLSDGGGAEVDGRRLFIDRPRIVPEAGGRLAQGEDPLRLIRFEGDEGNPAGPAATEKSGEALPTFDEVEELIAPSPTDQPALSVDSWDSEDQQRIRQAIEHRIALGDGEEEDDEASEEVFSARSGKGHLLSRLLFWAAAGTVAASGIFGAHALFSPEGAPAPPAPFPGLGDDAAGMLNPPTDAGMTDRVDAPAAVPIEPPPPPVVWEKDLEGFKTSMASDLKLQVAADVIGKFPADIQPPAKAGIPECVSQGDVRFKGSLLWKEGKLAGAEVVVASEQGPLNLRMGGVLWAAPEKGRMTIRWDERGAATVKQDLGIQRLTAPGERPHLEMEQRALAAFIKGEAQQKIPAARLPDIRYQGAASVRVEGADGHGYRLGPWSAQRQGDQLWVTVVSAPEGGMAVKDGQREWTIPPRESGTIVIGPGWTEVKVPAQQMPAGEAAEGAGAPPVRPWTMSFDQGLFGEDLGGYLKGLGVGGRGPNAWGSPRLPEGIRIEATPGVRMGVKKVEEHLGAVKVQLVHDGEDVAITIGGKALKVPKGNVGTIQWDHDGNVEMKAEPIPHPAEFKIPAPRPKQGAAGAGAPPAAAAAAAEPLAIGQHPWLAALAGLQVGQVGAPPDQAGGVLGADLFSVLGTEGVGSGKYEFADAAVLNDYVGRQLIAAGSIPAGAAVPQWDVSGNLVGGGEFLEEGGSWSVVGGGRVKVTIPGEKGHWETESGKTKLTVRWEKAEGKPYGKVTVVEGLGVRRVVEAPPPPPFKLGLKEGLLGKDLPAYLKGLGVGRGPNVLGSPRLPEGIEIQVGPEDAAVGVGSSEHLGQTQAWIIPQAKEVEVAIGGKALKVPPMKAGYIRWNHDGQVEMEVGNEVVPADLKIPDPPAAAGAGAAPQAPAAGAGVPPPAVEIPVPPRKAFALPPLPFAGEMEVPYAQMRQEIEHRLPVGCDRNQVPVVEEYRGKVGLVQVETRAFGIDAVGSTFALIAPEDEAIAFWLNGVRHVIPSGGVELFEMGSSPAWLNGRVTFFSWETTHRRLMPDPPPPAPSRSDVPPLSRLMTADQLAAHLQKGLPSDFPEERRLDIRYEGVAAVGIRVGAGRDPVGRPDNRASVDLQIVAESEIRTGMGKREVAVTPSHTPLLVRLLARGGVEVYWDRTAAPLDLTRFGGKPIPYIGQRVSAEALHNIVRAFAPDGYTGPDLPSFSITTPSEGEGTVVLDGLVVEDEGKIRTTVLKMAAPKDGALEIYSDGKEYRVPAGETAQILLSGWEGRPTTRIWGGSRHEGRQPPLKPFLFPQAGRLAEQQLNASFRAEPLAKVLSLDQPAVSCKHPPLVYRNASVHGLDGTRARWVTYKIVQDLGEELAIRVGGRRYRLPPDSPDRAVYVVMEEGKSTVLFGPGLERITPFSEMSWMELNLMLRKLAPAPMARDLRGLPVVEEFKGKAEVEVATAKEPLRPWASLRVKAPSGAGIVVAVRKSRQRIPPGEEGFILLDKDLGALVAGPDVEMMTAVVAEGADYAKVGDIQGRLDQLRRHYRRPEPARPADPKAQAVLEEMGSHYRALGLTPPGSAELPPKSAASLPPDEVERHLAAIDAADRRLRADEADRRRQEAVHLQAEASAVRQKAGTSAWDQGTALDKERRVAVLAAEAELAEAESALLKAPDPAACLERRPAYARALRKVEALKLEQHGAYLPHLERQLAISKQQAEEIRHRAANLAANGQRIHGLMAEALDQAHRVYLLERERDRLWLRRVAQNAYVADAEANNELALRTAQSQLADLRAAYQFLAGVISKEEYELILERSRLDNEHARLERRSRPPHSRQVNLNDLEQLWIRRMMVENRIRAIQRRPNLAFLSPTGLPQTRIVNGLQVELPAVIEEGFPLVLTPGQRRQEEERVRRLMGMIEWGAWIDPKVLDSVRWDLHRLDRITGGGPLSGEPARLADRWMQVRRAIFDGERRLHDTKGAVVRLREIEGHLAIALEEQYQEKIRRDYGKDARYWEDQLKRLEQEIRWLQREAVFRGAEQEMSALSIRLYDEMEKSGGLLLPPVAGPVRPETDSLRPDGFGRMLDGTPVQLFTAAQPRKVWFRQTVFAAGNPSVQEQRMVWRKDEKTGEVSFHLEESIDLVLGDTGGRLDLFYVYRGGPRRAVASGPGSLTVTGVPGGFFLDPGRPIPLGEVVRTDPKTDQRLPSEYGLIGHVATRVEWVEGPKGPGRYEVVPHFLARHVPIERYRDALERKGPFDFPWGPGAVDAEGKPNKDSRYFGTMYLGGLDVHAREPQWVLDRYGVRGDPGQQLPVVWVPPLRAEVIYEPRIQVNEEGNLVLTLRKQPAVPRPAPPRGGLEEPPAAEMTVAEAEPALAEVGSRWVRGGAADPALERVVRVLAVTPAVARMQVDFELTGLLGKAVKVGSARVLFLPEETAEIGGMVGELVDLQVAGKEVHLEAVGAGEADRAVEIFKMVAERNGFKVLAVHPLAGGAFRDFLEQLIRNLAGQDALIREEDLRLLEHAFRTLA